MTRREAREAAFILLFEHCFKEDAPEETMALAADAREMKISAFGKGLFEGAVAKLSEVDAALERALIRWEGDRLSRVARAAMRLCVYEMMFTELPAEIAVNEAIELIKRYDGEESASFANGVLGGVDKALKEQA
ncbi:MAG: transcription antitermination factor NusB [Clostridia bacterium]|nr:transcription antitermination factor NusB [Clostridia bacterium]